MKSGSSIWGHPDNPDYVYFKNFELVSGVQRSDSITCIHVSIFQILFPFRFLQNIEQLSLCYAIGPPYWLSTVGKSRGRDRLGMWD